MAQLCKRSRSSDGRALLDSLVDEPRQIPQDLFLILDDGFLVSNNFRLILEKLRKLILIPEDSFLVANDLRLILQQLLLIPEGGLCHSTFLF
jgi:hypothetical protein